MPIESCSSVLVKIPATVTGIVLSLSSTFPSSMMSPTDRPLRWANFSWISTWLPVSVVMGLPSTISKPPSVK